MIQIQFSNLFYNGNLELRDSEIISLTVTGHSGVGTKGNDVICAGISALFQTYILSVSKILGIEQTLKKGPDGFLRSEIIINRVSIENREKLKLLIETFFLGSTEISKEYPGIIKIDIATD